MVRAGYPIGVTIAQIIAAEGWREADDTLLADAAAALAGIADVDPTIELITHRCTPGSKAVLESWYPGSALDMGANNRMTKRTKFATEKQMGTPINMPHDDDGGLTGEGVTSLAI